MSNINQVFKYNRQRKNVIMGGTVILICITLLSCVSSFMIYREGFIDLPAAFQVTLSIIAVIVVEGAFVWLVYGFTRAFSSMLERAISFAGMAFLVCVMFINIVTHFMMVKSLTLHPLQETWLSWGAVSVFIAVLLIVLSITLSDPVIRLIRLELRYQGRQQEIILEAKTDGLQSEKLQAAMADRAEWEAGQLAARILGSPVQSGALSAAALTAPALTAHQVTGFSRAGLPTQGNFSTEGSYQALMEERDPKGLSRQSD